MELTPEQKSDVDTRTRQFLERHYANVKELEVDFAMLPIPVQIQEGVYAMQVKAMPIDTKYISKPSPFVPGAPIIKE